MKEKIDWTKFNDKYVRLVTGVEKRLKLANWTGGEWLGKPGISFDVLVEDGETSERQFTVISRKLIGMMKPIILKAEEDGKDTISVSILKTGESFDTRYTVKELPPSLKEVFKWKGAR